MDIYRKISVFLFSLLAIIEAGELINNIVILTNKTLLTQMATTLHLSESITSMRLSLLAFYSLVLAISALLVARGLVKKWESTFYLAIFSTLLFVNYSLIDFMQARKFKALAAQLDMMGTFIFLITAAAFGTYYISREIARKKMMLESLSEDNK